MTKREVWEKKSRIADKEYITLETEIDKKFNKFFTKIGPSLARKILLQVRPLKAFKKSQHHLNKHFLP